ncbi:hemerythrin domain-containing protein [Massilia sp. DWR3-1-1]|uniref:hemerythrin domain-containing protein n=1 Tax=Massilia sp. DWR3-1-1 TaxID=2804559 RepID=UPI003CF4723D
MAGTSKSTSTSSSPVTGAAASIDAIDLLTQDHEEVRGMFDTYDALSDRSIASKRRLALEICLALTKHATAEEEIFYPAVRAAVEDAGDLVDEAQVEHASAKDLIAQIVGMDPQDDLYDAKLKVLAEQIEHHVDEEEGEMFPQARKAGLDLAALGQAIVARKQEVALPRAQ